ncbi:hypothetical protein AHF37_06716 [Paragonimus kellicotti]|nr:hypothetical protein AHF37_06716 [Paragonimus kellicotti]
MTNSVLICKFCCFFVVQFRLQLSRKHSCLIWSTTNAEADRLMEISEQEFVHELTDALCRPSVQSPIPVLALAKTR